MKFIENTYEELESGQMESCTTVSHLGITFFGNAITAPEEEHPSNLFGGRLSESRAVLHALQYERDLRYEEYKTISNFIKSCLNTKKFDANSPSAKVMFHQLNIAEKKYKEAKEIVKSLGEAIQEMIDDRDKFFKKRTKEIKE